ncbi:PspC domain-containing protein [Amphibacillus sp. Q70]|uniref:PspC domain-containing protein n=1 Tax=Amphibacillus sp. Q70 TaxID=3453416 RepID=UPI003F87F88F
MERVQTLRKKRIRVPIERRSLRLSEDKVLFGVCGGIGEFFDISPNIVRLIFILTNAGSFVIYLILAIYLNGDRFL